MDLGLKGKTVIVTGGSGGIGRGLLMEFAREGCNVINASRDMKIGAAIEADAKSQGLKGTILSVKTDVTDRAIHCTQAVAHDMLSRNTGSVINISSNSGLLGEASQQIVHYGAVKGFVNSFSKSLAYEWGPRGVRVNNIA